MPLPKELYEILACPICKEAIRYTKTRDGLYCKKCDKVYPIKDGIPCLLPV